MTSPAPLPTGNIAIYYSSSDSATSLCSEIAGAINGLTGFGCTATAQADGAVTLNGLHLSVDLGQTPFAISGNSQQGAVYEFVDTSVTPLASPAEGHLPIYFNSTTDNTAAIQAEMVQAINGYTSAIDLSQAAVTAALDGDQFQITSGSGTPVEFEFYPAGGPTPSLPTVGIPFSSGESVANLAAAVDPRSGGRYRQPGFGEGAHVGRGCLRHGPYDLQRIRCPSPSSRPPPGPRPNSGPTAPSPCTARRSCSTPRRRSSARSAARRVPTRCRSASRKRRRSPAPASPTPTSALPPPASNVKGKPTTSPFTVDSSTLGTNTTFANAANLGDLLATGQGTLTVAGNLTGLTDVNWYKFSLDYGKSIQNLDGDVNSVYPLTFSVNYASGLARPDTEVWVFDATGTLIYNGDNSNITDNKDSFDVDDAYIGPIYLEEGAGEVYYVAVTGKDMTATALSQTLLRQEPSDSVTRVVENHIGSTDGSAIAKNATQTITLAADAFTLGDVTLYANTKDQLDTVDPYTGAFETNVTGGIDDGIIPDGKLPNVDDQAAYNDISMRDDGELYSMVGNTTGTQTYGQLNTGNAQTFVTSQNTGLNTWAPNGTATGLISYLPGITFQALTQGHELGTGEPPELRRGVDQRHATPGPRPPTTCCTCSTSTATRSSTPIPFPTTRAPTLPTGHGWEATSFPTRSSPLPRSYQPCGRPRSSPTPAPTTVPAPRAFSTASLQDLLDGSGFVLDANPGVAGDTPHTFEFDSGPDYRMNTDTNNANNQSHFVRDGDTLKVVVNGVTKNFEFDSGPVLVLGSPTGAAGPCRRKATALP